MMHIWLVVNIPKIFEIGEDQNLGVLAKKYQTCTRIQVKPHVFCENSVQIWIASMKNSFLAHGDRSSTQDKR
jgi:hypothetical protein